MKTKITLAIALMICISFSSYSQTTIFPSGQTWKYLDNGSDQGTAWKETGFNDTTWSSGQAQLGYGDGDEITVVDDGPNTNRYPTTYFRYSFSATAMEAAFQDIILEAIRDDGMVVYLNGAQVWSSNMPGTFDYLTYAAGNATNENSWISSTISNSLVVGTNLLAVEIHQANATSSDISFDFRLFGIAISDELIAANATWKYKDNGSDQGTAWRNNGFDDTSWLSGAAELGYGDGDEATIVDDGPNNNRYPTTYFRKSFTVADHTLYGSLSLEAVRDDGMVVYINGNQVWNDGVPNTFNYLTYAYQAIGTTIENAWITMDVSNYLITGTNVVAVEIHQVNATSLDISFNFKLTAKGVNPAEIVRGPYLQKETTSSIAVKWKTNTTTESIVNYGTTLGNLSSSVSDNAGKLNHELEITSLQPFTKYYYNIANSDGVYVPANANMYFVTAPSTGSDQFVRAWILGDAGTGNQNQRNVRDQYYNYAANASTNPNQTDMMLFLGDNAYIRGSDSEYQEKLFDVYGEMLKKAVAWSTLGNHDGRSADSNTQSGVYYDIFTFPTAAEAGGLASGTEAYYSFDYANIHFIVLDSYETDRSVGGAMYNWALSDIQNTNQDWIVALFHHPPYTKGSHDSDSTIGDEAFMGLMRNNFLPILEDNGVDLVLSGHSHSYERSYFLNGHYGLSDTFNLITNTVGANGNLSGKADTGDGAYVKDHIDTEGAVYITTGSAGKITGGLLNHNAMYASLNELGSCVLEIDSDGGTGQNLTVKFITATGSITDYFTINKTGLTLSIENNELESNEIIVYPVPANSILNIDISATENIRSIKIYDVIGKMVKETTANKINVSSLKSGMYIIQIKTDKSEYFKNIIIN